MSQTKVRIILIINAKRQTKTAYRTYIYYKPIILFVRPPYDKFYDFRMSAPPPYIIMTLGHKEIDLEWCMLTWLAYQSFKETDDKLVNKKDY